MNLLENYNTARQKYGERIVKELSDIGIPPQYLLSACRFYKDIQLPIEKIQQWFRQWMTYVVKNNQTIDVNKLSFEQFYQTIQKYKAEYGIPNKVYSDEQVSIGKINSAKDVSRFPVKNNWCIKQPRMFQKYINNGYSFMTDLAMKYNKHDAISQQIEKRLDGTSHLREVKRIADRLNQKRNFWDKSPYRVKDDGLFPSITSVTEYIHPHQHRTLSLRELARVMNYPDGYDFTDPNKECKIPVT